ncbi:hypothetical protein ACHAWO_007182 [Cyclotella atomus]|uniref:F-box domain-containing protein n=1 Tax=Cyclotella atomus TaxID=382360 RepID=A0ABD3N696_9STRA
MFSLLTAQVVCTWLHSSSNPAPTTAIADNTESSLKSLSSFNQEYSLTIPTSYSPISSPKRNIQTSVSAQFFSATSRYRSPSIPSPLSLVQQLILHPDDSTEFSSLLRRELLLSQRVNTVTNNSNDDKSTITKSISNSLFQKIPHQLLLDIASTISISKIQTLWS